MSSRARRVLFAFAARGAALLRPRHPMVSVIVPAHNTAEYLDDALDSVLAQELRDIEVIVIDDGSTDRTYWRALRKASGDARLRVYRQRSAGAGPAREHGIGRARGRYLAFLDSDDVLPPDSLARLVESAERTGSQIAVGAFRRFDATDAWVPEWVGELHARDAHATTLERTPKLLRNNYPCGKVFRRDFWESVGQPFRSDPIYEDQPLIARLMMSAASIDVLETVTYDYRRRTDRSSISQRPEEIFDLRQRRAAWERTIDLLVAERAPEAIVRAWYWTLYQTHMHWYLDNDAISDVHYWRELRASLLHLAEWEPHGARAEVAASQRAALALLALDRHDDFLVFRAAGGYSPSRFFRSATPSGLEYAFPVELPAEARRTDLAGVRVDQVIDGVGMDDDDLVVTGRAWLRGTPPADGSVVEVRLRERNPSAGFAPRTLPSSTSHDGGFRARLVVDDLAAGEYLLEATVRLGPVLLDFEVAEPSWVDPPRLEFSGSRRVIVTRRPNHFVPVRIEVLPQASGTNG